ncbi:MAG: phage tail tape measure protein [Firmicutes bacterium]|nr:phage tail tape measure protein [Bacillota bacterium]
MLSLSAPTDKAAKTLKDLGLEVFDANGKLRPLNETFKDLDGKLSQMTDKEKTNVLNTLFNKVDLKSVNALLANSGERFDELSGYIRNSAGAAADMAETMNDNLKGKLTILGSALEGLGIEMYEEFEQPFKEAAETAIKSVDTISYSLKNGKLSESMQTVARAIGSMASKAAELAINALPKMIDGFAFLVDNAKILGTVLASTAGAVATFKGVMLFNDIQNSLKAATTAARMFGAGMTTSLTGMQAAVGVATGKLGIMQAAVAALGSPMGVAALAAAGVTAGIIALSLASKNNASDLEKNKKAIEEFTEELEESQKIRDAIEERRQEALETSFAEIDNTERQISSLEELVDANGKVKEGYEDKAAALAEQINSVIPNAISMTEDESGAYLKVADSIDLMIAKKKINALIDANQESYANALKESREAADKYSEALENQKVAHENLQKATSDTTSKQEIYDINLKKAQETANEADKAVEELAKQYEESINIITEQNNLLTASQSESTEEINNAIASQGVALKQYTADQLEEADKQLQNEKEKYDNLKRLYQDFNNEYTKSQLDAQKDVVEKAQAIRDNAYAEAEQASKAAGEAEVNAMINGISGLTETLKSEMKKTVDTAVEAANSIEQDMQQSGINAILGFAQGLQHQPSINKVINSAISLGTLAIVNLNKALDEHSPSKKTEKSGEDFDEGLAIGVEKNKGSVMESVEDLSQEALDIANKSSSDYKEIGELYGENYLSGLETMLDGTVELIEKNTDTMIKTYEKSMEEQTDASVKEIEAQTDAQVEAIDDQISKLKDVKDKAQKEANKEEIKQKEKEKKQIKEYSKERIQQIKDDAKEQTNAYKKGMQTLEKAGIDIIKKASSDIEKEYKKRQDAIVEQFQSQKDEILSLQDSLYSKTSEYGELFHYDEETGEMLLNDLTKNTQAVEQYYNSLEELSNIEGISDGFVKMIATEYDVEEGTKLLNELLKMSDTRLQSYAAEWDKLQEVSSKGSQSFLEEELNVIDTSFNQAMEKLANDMPVFTKEALNNAINEIATIFPEKYAELIAIDPNFFDNMINTLNAEILGSISQKEGVVVPVKTEVGDIAQQVTEQTPAVQQAGSELTISIAETVENNGDEVVDAVDNVSKDSVQAMESYKPDFKEVGADYIDMLTEGMKSKWSTAVSVAGDIARSLKEELEEVASFSVKSNEEAMTARQLVESAEPSLLHSLYNDMLSAVEIQQSRVAAASASYITNNNQSSTVENNMGDINFNIAEVKGNSADRSVDKLMQQAEFYRRQRNLAVGVR